MAGDDSYRERLYSTMDERDLSWIEECLRSLSGDHYAKNDYFRRLRETVLALARKGHAIFLGRAADLILPQNVGLRVRLEAGREFRINQFAKANSLALDKAEQGVDGLEQDRAKFFLNHFGVDAAEPTRHDLIINVERFGTKQAVELIVAAMRLKGSEV
jgi:cytidylate kinase